MSTMTRTIPTHGATCATILTAMRMSDWLWGAFGLALMVAYWPGVAGLATTPRWDVAAVLVIAYFIGPRVRMTAVHRLGLALIAWLAVTLSFETGDARLDGGNELFQMAMIAVGFAVGSNVANLRLLVIGCAIGIGINSAFLIAETANTPAWLFSSCVDINGSEDVAHVVCLYFGNPAGLFYNQDRLAAGAAMVGVACLAQRRTWWCLPPIVPSLILVHSSAAWLAVAVGAYILAGQLPNSVGRTIRIVMIAAGCAAVAVKLGTNSTDERMAIWSDTIPSLTFWGNGLGSFREGFLAHAQSYDFARFQSRPEHPHNEWLWLAYEGGICAVVLACAFVVCLVRRRAQTGELAVLAAFAVLSLFAMPFHDPATAVLAALVAGRCAAGRDRTVECAVDRRVSLQPWLAADADPTEHGPFEGRANRFSVPAAVS
jgi:hypothetical protein